MGQQHLLNVFWSTKLLRSNPILTGLVQATADDDDDGDGDDGSY